MRPPQVAEEILQPAPEIRSPLELVISVEKDRYALGEPLYLHARLTNVSDSPVNVSPLRLDDSGFPPTLGLALTTGSGAPIRARIAPVPDASVVTGPEYRPPVLLPGEAWMTVVDLLVLYGAGEERGNSAFSRRRVPRGDYQLEAYYRADFSRSGILRSNRLRFVVGRAGPRELLARWRVYRAHRRFRRDRPDKDLVRAVVEYRKVIEEHPKSPFAQDAFRALLEYDSATDLAAFRSLLETALERYRDPHFFYNPHIYWEEGGGVSGPQMEEYLRRLTVRYRNRTVAAIAWQKLKFEEITRESGGRSGAPSGTASEDPGRGAP